MNLSTQQIAAAITRLAPLEVAAQTTFGKDIEENKQAIDKMSYAELLHHWRFSHVGHKFFAGPLGVYFGKKMEERRSAMSPADAVAVSKFIGWTE